MSTTIADVEGQTKARRVRRAAISGFFGSALEYYDFIIYGTAAALVFGKVFFSDMAGGAGALVSVATFGVAYVARPFGAIFWGHIGDRLGRRTALMLSIGFMGCATFFIGILPSYGTVGLAAPILLVLLRLLQGISAGGEVPGSSSLTVEHAPDGKRAFYTAFSMSGMQLGMSLGTLVFLPIAALPQEQLVSWGWRIPFLISGVLTVIAYLLRRNLEEPEVFKEVREGGKTDALPIVTLLRYHWKATLRVLICSCINVVGTIFNVFTLAYVTQNQGVSSVTMLVAVSVGNIGAAVMAPVVGIWADRFGRRPVYIIGAVGASSTLFVLFNAIDSGNVMLLLVAAVLGISVFYSMAIGVGAAYYAEQFPSKVRYTGMAVGLMLGLVAAGFAPTIAQALGAGPSSWQPAVWMCVAVGILGAIAALAGPETGRKTTRELG
ncbi:MFS transporter [Pseudarthrobacter sp. fls2-241-R2A-127]|uniref:MFS transporter n=1 Tax=Pseudarthrobacter sp. fls2-241-R2A-127 TaxID=3040303 RepID=UPI002556FE40|nr:MFS transporter [Pseudarthrobacter sp. fls2-241-R2A-127]